MARYIDAENPYIPPIFAENQKVTFLKGLWLQPAADVVEGKAIEQLKWERDTAIAQLESYGVGFCENKELTVVKHGEWRRDLNFYPYCTVCGENPWSAIKPEENLKYCPHCGAKMDGGKVSE